MRGEVICIGTELLLGQIINTNAAFLAQELATLGIDLYYQVTVGDNLERIVAVIEQAWRRSRVVILSGGLGPTQDDLTREAIAKMLGEDLKFSPEAWRQIEGFFFKLGRPLAANNKRQAYLPASGRMINNCWGTAPGVLLDKDNRVLIALPGVPVELKQMWQTEVRPYLARMMINYGSPVLTSKVVKMVGISESGMEEMIADLISDQSNPTLAPYAGRGEVILRITAKSNSVEENQNIITPVIQMIEDRLGSYIYGYDETDLAAVVGGFLRKLGENLAVAESCTGGLVCHRITNISGSSEYFLGGINSYSNHLKVNNLGVAAEIIETYGAVSAETVKAMAESIRFSTGAEIGLATTGFVDPNNCHGEEANGVVFFGIAFSEKTVVKKRVFSYDRVRNKELAAQTALIFLWQELKLRITNQHFCK